MLHYDPRPRDLRSRSRLASRDQADGHRLIVWRTAGAFSSTPYANVPTDAGWRISAVPIVIGFVGNLCFWFYFFLPGSL